jgi:starch-binding outer membrane protein, SusD/RagB family
MIRSYTQRFHSLRKLFRAPLGVVSVLGVAGMMGCNALDVNDPTKFRVQYVTNEFGATAAVNAAHVTYMQGLQDAVMESGRLTDEFFSSSDNNGRVTNQFAGHGVFNGWQRAYSQMTTELPLVQQYSPPSQHGTQVGEMFALRGFVLVNLGEQMCSGFPVIQLEIDGEVIVPRYDSDPQTADSAFERALADFDSALANTGSDSTRVRQLAQIGRGRALLGLGRFTEAQAAVAGVETAYLMTLAAQYGLYLPFSNDYGGETTISDREGINGLDFVSAHDPRLEVGQSVRWNGDTLWTPAKYMNGFFEPIVVASGIEARLIEAEGQLAAAPAGSAWLNTLNALRATVALPDTTDPGTPEGRVNLLFRERAFWLFGTAHRLGDVRRLVAKYGRNAESVFPTGELRYGDYQTTYGSWTSLQFDGVGEHVFYPKITGCSDP